MRMWLYSAFALQTPVKILMEASSGQSWLISFNNFSLWALPPADILPAGALPAGFSPVGVSFAGVSSAGVSLKDFTVPP